MARVWQRGPVHLLWGWEEKGRSRSRERPQGLAQKTWPLNILVCGSGHLIHPFIRQLVTPSFASTCEEDAAGNSLLCVFRGLGLCESRGCIGVVKSGQTFPERLFRLYISTIAAHGLPHRHILTSACSCLSCDCSHWRCRVGTHAIFISFLLMISDIQYLLCH